MTVQDEQEPEGKIEIKETRVTILATTRHRARPKGSRSQRRANLFRSNFLGRGSSLPATFQPLSWDVDQREQKERNEEDEVYGDGPELPREELGPPWMEASGGHHFILRSLFPHCLLFANTRWSRMGISAELFSSACLKLDDQGWNLSYERATPSSCIIWIIRI